MFRFFVWIVWVNTKVWCKFHLNRLIGNTFTGQNIDVSNTYFPHCISTLTTASGRTHYVFRLSVNPSHSCEHDISKPPWGSFFKFGINNHLDSRRNWLDCGGQRSRRLRKNAFCLVNVLSLERLERTIFKFGTTVHWDSHVLFDWILIKGHGGLTKHVFGLLNMISQVCLCGISSNFDQCHFDS